MKNGYSQKWKNTVVSLLMAMTMVISILPMSASAQDTQDIITFGTSDVATPATTSDNSVILTGDGEGCTCDSFCSDPDCTVCKDDKTQCFYYYCVCESACDENNANAECPVCKDDYTSCAQAVEVPEIQAVSVAQRTKTLDLTAASVEKQADSNSWGNPTSQDIDALSVEGWAWYCNAGSGYSANTLVLNDLNMLVNITGVAAITLPTGNATIVLNGTNMIAQDAATNAIYANGNLTIKGNGTLNLTSNGNGIRANGGNLIIDEGIITVSAPGIGIVAPTSITINGGTISSTGTGNGIFTAAGGLSITGGTVTAISSTRAINNNYTVPNGYSYYVSTTTTPSTTELTGDGSSTVIGSTHQYAKIVAKLGALTFVTGVDQSGTGYNWNGSTHILILSGLNLSVSGTTSAITLPDGSTIIATGTNTVAQTGTGKGISVPSGDPLTITGSGKLSITSSGANAIDCYGIEIDMDGGELEANSSGGNGKYGIVASTVTMKNGTVKAGGQCSSGVYAPSGFSMDGGTLTAIGTVRAISPNYTVPAGYSYYVNAVDTTPSTIELTGDGSTTVITNTHKYAKIVAVFSPNYTLYCNPAGFLFKDSGFATPYTEQTGKWSSSFGMLTLLEGFDFTTSAATALVMPAATTIQVDGNSTITSTFAGSGSYSYGIYDSGNLTIDVAEGKILNVTAGTPTNSASYGIGIDSGGFEKKGKGTLNAKGGENTSNDSIGIEMIGNFLMTDGIIFATGRGTTATKRSMAVYGGTAPTSGISIKAYDGTGYNDAATFETHSSGGIFIMDSNSNVVADTKITIDSSYDYTLEFSGSDGVLRKKGDSYTQPFVKGVDYTVSGMTLTLKEGFEFVTSANVALEVPAGTTIKADGDSRLESTFSASNDGSKGIDASGALTIDVAAGKTLTVISGSGTMNSGINTANSLTKSGTGTLKSTGSSGMGSYPYSHGICVNAGSFIMNGGIVYADIPDSATGDAMYVKNNNVPDNIIVMGKDAGGDYTVEAQFTGGWPVLKSDPTTVVKAAKLTVTVPGPGHSISGTITDNTGGTPTGTVTVKLYRGTTQVGGTVTLSNAPYNYSFNELSDGVYYIVAEHTTDGSKATLSAVINGANVTGKTVRLLPGSMESEIKIKSSGTPPTAVDGLDNLFDASDNIVVGLGGSVAITLEVEKKTAPVDADVIKGAATGQTVGLFLDLSVLKTQKDPNGSIINSDRLTDLTSLITIVFELPADLRGKSNLKIFRSHNGVAEELTATPNADGETAVVSGNIVTMTVCKFSTYAITYTPTGGGGSGSSSGTAYESPTVSNWLEPIPATLLANEAKKANQDTVFTRTGYTYGVRKASWQNLKGYFYYHDTMEKKAVQVRLYVDNPAAMTRDMYVTGAVKGSIVDSRKAMFEEWFTNKARIVHMDESAPWGQEIQIAAKVDLTEMDIKRLCFYSYDSRTNTYTRINNPKYFIDKNKYLHFYTELAGDIVISSGPLEKK